MVMSTPTVSELWVRSDWPLPLPLPTHNDDHETPLLTSTLQAAACAGTAYNSGTAYFCDSQSLTAVPAPLLSNTSRV